MNRLSKQVELFLEALDADERKYLLLKYDLGTLVEAIKVITRVEDTRIRRALIAKENQT